MNEKKQSLGKRISRFILVISGLAFGIRMLAEGLMSPEKMILFLVLVTIAAALDSLWVKLIITLFALGYVILDLVDHDMNQFQALFLNILALLLVLFGLFVIFGGLKSKI
jgi:hypothetical protein